MNINILPPSLREAFIGANFHRAGMGVFSFKNMSTKKLTYSEQLAHPNWQRKRLEILNRDSFECTDCGSKENQLHVHHKYYKKGKMAWDYPDDCLITLCGQCHKSLEDSKQALITVIGDLTEYDIQELTGYALAIRNEDDIDEIRKSPFMASGWVAYFSGLRGRWEKACELCFETIK
jgi:hypothetical protein